MATATLPRSIGYLVPVLARSIEECKYNSDVNMARFWLDEVLVLVYPDKLLLIRIEGQKQAEEMMERINYVVTRLVEDEG